MLRGHKVVVLNVPTDIEYTVINQFVFTECPHLKICYAHRANLGRREQGQYGLDIRILGPHVLRSRKNLPADCSPDIGNTGPLITHEVSVSIS
jgi:hypothetical protein